MYDADTFPLILHWYRYFSLIFPDEDVSRCNISIFHLHMEDIKLGQKGDIKIIREERGHINNYRRNGTYKLTVWWERWSERREEELQPEAVPKDKEMRRKNKNSHL